MSTNNKLRVVKLKNGDNLIAELTENRKSQLKLFRPMEIRYMHLFDSFGRRHEALVLVDWLKSTTQNEFVVDKDFILGIFTPCPDVIASYTKQKEYDDTGASPVLKSDKSASMVNLKGEQKSISDMLDDIEKQIQKLSNDDIMKLMGMDSEEDDDDGDDETPTNKVVEKNKKEKLIDEEADPSYGTNYSDWSPNLEDYL